MEKQTKTGKGYFCQCDLTCNGGIIYDPGKNLIKPFL